MEKTSILDLDGVINPWVGPFHPYMLAHELFLATAHTYEMSDWNEWHHYRNYGIVDPDFVKMLQDFAREGRFTSGPPFEGTPEAVRRLHDGGVSIHVVTDRPPFVLDETVAWLKTYDIPFDSVEIGRDKTVFMRRGPAPYFGIDDRVENVQALVDAGVQAYLLTAPWNEHANLPRVNTVDEYVDIVLAS